MSRIRTIKPGFFLNEELAELEPIVRLLFIGLWTQADREGRLLDRPKRIKAELFPYDEIDINSALNQLRDKRFIVRYTTNDPANHAKQLSIIQIVKFANHQNPHHREPESLIPAQGKPQANTGQAQGEPQASPSLAVQEGKGREGKGREGETRAHTREETPKNENSYFPEFLEIHEALTGRIFMDETCAAKSWNQSEFYEFTINWLENKRVSGDYVYNLSRLKYFLISDFEKKINNKINQNGRTEKSSRGLKAEVSNSSEFGTLRS